MNNVDNVVLEEIIITFERFLNKKFFKNIVRDLNIKKNIFLYYSKNRDLPICAVPKFNLILVSKKGFITFFYNLYVFFKNKGITLDICKYNMQCVAKFVISHEVGHILDISIKENRDNYVSILTNLIDTLLEHDLDLTDIEIHKKNLPKEVDENLIALKKNIVDREVKAWDIARDLLNIYDLSEKELFSRIKEYALATYNYGNIKNVIRENNIDTIFKYRKMFSK